jgi:hypothetical protein
MRFWYAMDFKRNIAGAGDEHPGGPVTVKIHRDFFCGQKEVSA